MPFYGYPVTVTPHGYGWFGYRLPYWLRYFLVHTAVAVLVVAVTFHRTTVLPVATVLARL